MVRVQTAEHGSRLFASSETAASNTKALEGVVAAAHSYILSLGEDGV